MPATAWSCAQAQVLMRASDPLYEVGMSMGGHSQEDRHWKHTLRQLALHFGVDGRADDRVGVRRQAAPVVARGQRVA